MDKVKWPHEQRYNMTVCCVEIVVQNLWVTVTSTDKGNSVSPVALLPAVCCQSCSITAACWFTLCGYSVLIRFTSDVETPSSEARGTQSAPKRLLISDSLISARWIESGWPSTVSKHLLSDFYVLLTVHLSTILDNDQLDTHLLYFTIHYLQSSTCFEHYTLIIRRLNCNDATSGIVTLSQWPSGAPDGLLSDDTRSCINTIQPPDDEHIMLKTCREL